MGRRRGRRPRSQTLPSSPAHSLSSSSPSSDFEFSISRSPHKPGGAALCPADDLFYKGQLLPLQLSPRLSMVRTLTLASSSSSSDFATASSRDSSGSSTDSHSFADCDWSRPCSVAQDREPHKRVPPPPYGACQIKKSAGYFSLARFSAVFKKGAAKARPAPDNWPSRPSSVKRVSASPKEVICKYLRKVKPLCERGSQKLRMEGAGAPPPNGGVRPGKELRETGLMARRCAVAGEYLSLFPGI